MPAPQRNLLDCGRFLRRSTISNPSVLTESRMAFGTARGILTGSRAVVVEMLAANGIPWRNARSVPKCGREDLNRSHLSYCFTDRYDKRQLR